MPFRNGSSACDSAGVRATDTEVANRSLSVTSITVLACTTTNRNESSAVSSAAVSASATGVKKGRLLSPPLLLQILLILVGTASFGLTSVTVSVCDTDVANRSLAHSSTFLPVNLLLVSNTPLDGPFPYSLQREVDVELLQRASTAICIST